MNSKNNDLSSSRLYMKYKKELNQARKLAKQIGHGYLGNEAIERPNIHDAFCFFKTKLNDIKNDNERLSVEYSASVLINTITLHVILKAFDMK